MIKKFFWYIERIAFLLIVCFRLLIYCIFHPKKIFTLLFSIYSNINDFYQVSHGQLRNFEDTESFKKMTEYVCFSRSNIFNADLKVTRSVETQAIASLTSSFQPKKIFEIGTYNGFTTLHFAVNSPEACEIYTLDLPPDFNQRNASKTAQYSYDDLLVVELSMKHINERVYKNHPQEYKVRELFGDSSQFDFSPYYGTMDMVFIDGNHSYPFIKSDTEHAFKMLSENGVIIWHDYDYIIHRDVFKYLNKLSTKHKIYSIPNTRFAVYGKNLT